MKDVQNRKTRKEREEISQLKTEVESLKECSKLKDAKNGATQARLRTQIKSYEKEVTNLKEELENLRKQNAKLQLVQKNFRKSNDTKMLHEINKNLSKLTKDVLTPPESKPSPDVTTRRKSYSNGHATDIDTNGDGGGKDLQSSSKDLKDNVIFNADFHGQNINQVASRKSLNLSENEDVILKGQYENENKNESRENDKNVINVNETTENDETDEVVKAYERAFGINSELRSSNNELVQKCGKYLEIFKIIYITNLAVNLCNKYCNFLRSGLNVLFYVYIASAPMTIYIVIIQQEMKRCYLTDRRRYRIRTGTRKLYAQMEILSLPTTTTEISKK